MCTNCIMDVGHLNLDLINNKPSKDLLDLSDSFYKELLLVLYHIMLISFMKETNFGIDDIELHEFGYTSSNENLPWVLTSEFVFYYGYKTLRGYTMDKEANVGVFISIRIKEQKSSPNSKPSNEYFCLLGDESDFTTGKLLPPNNDKVPPMRFPW